MSQLNLHRISMFYTKNKKRKENIINIRMLESHTFPLYASDINDFIMMECKENFYLMRLYDSAKSQNGIEANSYSMLKFFIYRKR